MNVRDPFSIRRTNALTILQGTATQAAAQLTQKVLETGAQALESGKQAVEDMSTFSIPKNVPSFSDPQRELENRVWGASGITSRAGNGYAGDKSVMDNVQDRMGGFFEKNRDLPMYKDKPYASSRRYKPMWKRRRLLALGGLFVMYILWLFGLFGGETGAIRTKDRWKWLGRPEKSSKNVDWLDRRERVVDAFKLSWDAYERQAWGFDEFHPVSKKGRQMTPNGMGWIIVDALDTLMLMNLTTRLTHAREWISTKLDYDQDQEVNTFETTIRMVGGLLSAHYLSTTYPDMAPISEDDPGTAGEDLYLEKARDLADRVIGAFETGSGIPYASVNLKTGQGVESHDDGGASSTAEAATLQLEFKYLAKLTGEKFFWDKAEKVIQVIDDNGMEDGLVPIYIYAPTGVFRGNNIRLGSRGDSYYEYLIKQYLQTNEPIYKDMWNDSLAGVRKHLITYSDPLRFTILAERQNGLSEALTPKMDHLVCFMPGTIALAATGGLTEAAARALPSWSAQHGADMLLARELMTTCWGMYKAMATGLAPEIAHFNIDTPPPPHTASHPSPESFTFDPSPDADWRKDFVIKPNDRHNLQRPETVESLFYMWRITGEVKYREWGWEMFRSFMNYTAVEDGGGFTSLRNADTIPPEVADNMESFWLAETLKYFYLLFSPTTLLPLSEIVINTEAHPFPRFEMGKLFSTGWTRKPRDKDGKIIPEKKVETKTEVKKEVKKVKVTQTVVVEKTGVPSVRESHVGKDENPKVLKDVEEEKDGKDEVPNMPRRSRLGRVGEP